MTHSLIAIRTYSTKVALSIYKKQALYVAERRERQTPKRLKCACQMMDFVVPSNRCWLQFGYSPISAVSNGGSR
jgi:hypothetical protein